MPVLEEKNDNYNKIPFHSTTVCPVFKFEPDFMVGLNGDPPLLGRLRLVIFIKAKKKGRFLILFKNSIQFVKITDLN